MYNIDVTYNTPDLRIFIITLRDASLYWIDDNGNRIDVYYNTTNGYVIYVNDSLSDLSLNGLTPWHDIRDTIDDPHWIVPRDDWAHLVLLRLASQLADRGQYDIAMSLMYDAGRLDGSHRQ